jgi:putative hemolysin
MESDPGPANVISQLILIVVLTLINAFFSSAEIAVASVNKTRIKLLAEDGNKRAKLVETLLEEPTKFLSTIQVGITLAGFFSSATAATGLSGDFGLFLSKYNVPYAEKISLVLITIALSYFVLVFGELFPKRIALRKAEKIAMSSVKPILFISKISAPFIWILSGSTNLLSRLFRLSKSEEDIISREEIRSMVEAGQEHGSINESEKAMINSIFEFDDKLAVEVMTPRTNVYVIDINKPLTDYLDQLIEERYSRIPVYDGNSDNIIGILYMKDFMAEARRKGFEHVDIRTIIHTPYFVPERKNIDELFKELQGKKKHIAILVDEYGGFSGIVTIEDLIEEVMGDIDDEYDEDDPILQKIDALNYYAKGILPINDLEDLFNVSLEEVYEDYDTLGGFLTGLLGHIPQEGEEKVIEYDHLIFEIKEVKDKRIEKVKITVKQSEFSED